MTSRRTALSCRRCGAPGRWYLGGRLCPRHAPGGPDGEVMRPFPQVRAGDGSLGPAKTQDGPRGAGNTNEGLTNTPPAEPGGDRL